MEQKPQTISQRRGAANVQPVAIDSVGESLSKTVNGSAVNEKVCWIEIKHYPYQPDHQVELLHLQAEADALLIKLQARGQKHRVEETSL